LIFPGALFGTLVLADYSGPQGWHGLAEFFGWWALSIGASVWCAFLVRRFREKRTSRHWSLIAAIASALAFLVWSVVEALPSTPLLIKLLYTTSLQVVGTLAVLAVVGFFAWIAWSSRRRLTRNREKSAI